MTIAVNGRFGGRRATGVERYAAELTGCLDGRLRVVRPRRSLQGARGHLWEQAILPSLLQHDELLWSPANSGPIRVQRQVITIHDVSVIEHPKWFSGGFALWYRLMLPKLAWSARHVLTVSEHSRQSIMRLFGLPADRVTAVPNGVNHEMFRPSDPEPVRRKYGLTDRYVLFVGSIDPRKNLKRLIQAWRGIPEARKAELVVVGARSGIFRQPDLSGLQQGVRMLGYVPDQDLPALYSGALIFVMPSLYEGFGLTVLEAMACGAPVLSSTGGALPEVADGAAVLVDPRSEPEMAAEIRCLLKDECRRQELRAKGLARAAEFTWERSAGQIGALLEAHA